VPDHNGITTFSVLKVAYLLAVTAAAFMVPAFAATQSARWLVVPALLALQVVILLACRIRITEVVRPIWRLKWLFLFLIGCYVLLPAENPGAGDLVLPWRLPIVDWVLPLHLTGLERAGLMCLQILTLLLASTVVRLTGSGRDLVDGLRALRLPDLFIYSLDHTLELLGGAKKSRRGRAEPAGQGGALSTVKRLLRGDIGGFVETIRANIERAGESRRHESDRRLGPRLIHDIGIVTGIALCMASVKVLKLLPGLPFAPGHKALLLFPLYVLASRLTHSRWGGTAAGSIMGVIGFLQGDGRFGVLEILKHVAPGFVIDLAEPLVRRLPAWAMGYCFLGVAAAAGRITTELVLVLLLGARAEVYLFPTAVLVPNLLAGFLSGFVTIFVLRAFARSDAEMNKDRDAQTETVPDEAAEIPSQQLPAGPPQSDASAYSVWRK
jgi:Cobalt transport protein